MRALTRLLVCLIFLAAITARAGDIPPQGKPMETLQIPTIEFLAEQDGAFEQEVKDELIAALKEHKEIIRAYLVAVRYNQREQSVALCLEAISGSEKKIAKDISSVFARVAGRDMHLDVIFLTTGQHEQVKRVASAFYVAS